MLITIVKEVFGPWMENVANFDKSPILINLHMAYILVLSYYQGTILHCIMINLLNNSVGGRYWFSYMLAHGLCSAANSCGDSILEHEPTDKRSNTFPPQNYLAN